METVTRRLFEMRDEGYRDFVAKLIPTLPKERIIGVRSPELRAYARAFSKDEARFEFLRALPHEYYEENNLHAGLILLIRDFDEALWRAEAFLPFIDNWATCDGAQPPIFKTRLDVVYERVLHWLDSPHPYTVRYALVTLLKFYTDDAFLPETLLLIASLEAKDYYVRMAIAWYYSVALVKQYEKTLRIFEDNLLDPWLHNKSIQKAVESFRVEPARKAYLKTLRRS